jgi:hypothetical protein
MDYDFPFSWERTHIFQKGSNHQPVNILNIFDILNMYIMYVYILYIYTFSGFEMMFMYDHNIYIVETQHEMQIEKTISRLNP